MDIKIRKEEESDYLKIDNVIKRAFKNSPHTDNDEHNLVNRLRSSVAFVPELSLVAELEGEIIGHILFSRIKIISSNGAAIESLALAPVTVLPIHQGKGIGGTLIRKGHEVAKSLGFESIVLLGHAKYYPRFGYTKASKWGIKAPFDVPDDAFMAIELKDSGLNNVTGMVKYPPEFMLN